MRIGPLLKRLPVALLAIVVSFLLGLVAAGSRPPEARTFSISDPAPPLRTATPINPATTSSSSAGVPTDFASVAARLRPSIVSVYATARGSADNAVVTWRPRDSTAEPLSNAGAGFLIQPAGYILTNAHVVQDADRVMVTLSDDRVLRAEVVGTDPRPGIDVALLRVESTDGLPAVTFGKSSTLRVGEWVCAIGNPLGYTGSVTVGVVSSVDREIPTFAAVGVIQTDAAMSLGSSGGPLVNSRGQVVGITTAISTDSANIGFAIPIDQVNAIIPQLRDRGRVPRGFLSLRVAALTPELRRALSITPDHGAVIEEVTADSSADRSGLRTYDVVESVDDHALLSDYEFVHAIAARAPGSLVKLGIWRNGVRLVIPVKLEELPSPASSRIQPRSGVRPTAEPLGGPLGVVARDLSPATAKALPDAIAGVILADVDPAGPAQVAGLRKGFIILELNRHRTTTAAAFAAAEAALKPGDAAAVLFYDPVLREYRIATVEVDARP